MLYYPRRPRSRGNIAHHQHTKMFSQHNAKNMKKLLCVNKEKQTKWQVFECSVVFSFLNFGDGDGDVMIKYKTYSSMSRQQQGW